MKQVQPPKWADRFLEWYCRPELLEEIQGDLYELFDRRSEVRSPRQASFRYVWDVFRSFRLSTIKNLHFQLPYTMIGHYIKISRRNLWKHKSYTAINILGLTVGIATSMLIFLWTQDELSYDKFHDNIDELHQVKVNIRIGDGPEQTWGSTPYPLAEKLEKDYPEIEKAHYVANQRGQLLSIGDQSFKQDGMALDTGFLKSFSFPLITGEARLHEPNNILINRSIAEKFFGENWQNQNILGQSITVNNQREYQITGVLEDVPLNSSINFDFLFSLEEYLSRTPWNREWGNYNHEIYLRLAQTASGEIVSRKIESIIMDRLTEEEIGGAFIQIFLQPFQDVYLYNEFENGKVVGGRIEYVNIFLLVALFLLIIACVNFTNLATARAALRSKEIGVKKAVGASRSSLIKQFLSESVLLTLIAYIISVILVFFLLPSFNFLTNKEISLDISSPTFWQFSLGIIVFTGFAAGIYPAFFLTSGKTVEVLKSQLKGYMRGARLRKVLVVIQFSLTILMIVSTIVVYQQIQYIKNKNLGLDKSNVALIPLEGVNGEKYETFKNQVAQNTAIQSITGANFSPLMIWNSTLSIDWKGKADDEQVMFHIIQTDYNYIETVGIELLEGRTHDKAMGADSASYLINEAARDIMRMKEPVGQELSTWEIPGKIIGVVKDHHFASLYQPIEPMVIRLAPDELAMLIVRTKAGRTQEALTHIEQVKTQLAPSYPFEFDFMDEAYEELYRSEIVTGTLAKYFAAVAILVSCLGLLGLAAFTTARRNKEISIRKVLGASVGNLVMLLTKDFTILVLIAIGIALPIGAYFMSQWLDNFTYHIPLSPVIFVVAGLAAVLIAWITISYQAFKSAGSNPMKHLRSE